MLDTRFLPLHPPSVNKVYTATVTLRALAQSTNIIVILYFYIENGNYSQWSPWTPCSVTCGAGSRSRFRSCTNPPPGPYGEDCSHLGNITQTVKCNVAVCPGRQYSFTGVTTTHGGFLINYLSKRQPVITRMDENIMLQ